MAETGPKMAALRWSDRQRPLRRVHQTWKAAQAMTQEDLQKQRQQFWERAPAYGGQQEVWSALRSAIQTGDGDLETAQAILECAGVILPEGLLTEVYDDRGFRYELPMYVISDPVNLVSEKAPESLFKLRSRSRAGSGKPPRELLVRLSTGEDIRVALGPACRTIGELTRVTAEQAGLKLGPREQLQFFAAGHGPFVAAQALENLDLDPTVPIQAWITPVA